METSGEYLILDVGGELAAAGERKQSESAHVRSLLRSIGRRDAKGGLLIFDRAARAQEHEQQALLGALTDGAAVAFPRSPVSSAALFHQLLAGPLEAVLLGSHPAWDRGLEAMAVSRAAAETAIAQEWPRMLSGHMFETFLAAWLAASQPVHLVGDSREARYDARVAEDFEQRFPEWVAGSFEALRAREQDWVNDGGETHEGAAPGREGRRENAVEIRQFFFSRAFERFEKTRKTLSTVFQDHTVHALELAFGCSIPDLDATLWADVVFEALLSFRREEAVGGIPSVLLPALWLRAGSALGKASSPETAFREALLAFSRRRSTFLRRWNLGRRRSAEESGAEIIPL